MNYDELVAGRELDALVAEKRPVLSDLRDSGEIEESADVVGFLYRDEYYNEEASKYPNTGEVNTAKNRHGPTGRVDLYWKAETASYHNLERRSVTL
jgi:replicative DNA helicase